LALLLRASVLGGLLALVFAVVHVFGPRATRIDYMGAMAAKHARLGALASPKVMVIGGSNATFGIDSELLEKALCKPVVNMSLHAGLGFEFMAAEVKGHIGKGDLVIASLEHLAFTEPRQYGDIHMITVDRYPEAMRYLPWYRKPSIVLGILVMRTQGVWKVLSGQWKDDSPDPVYRANGFTERGDITSHHGLPMRPSHRIQPSVYFEPYSVPRFWSIVAQLNEEAGKNGAQLVFSWPVNARSSYKSAFHEAMARELKEHGYQVAGVPEDYIYPDTTFYDTHHHLRAAGRQLRTDRMVRDLCALEVVQCCIGEAP
jgi:hypothetical protein